MIEVERRRACINIRVPVDATAIWRAIFAVADAETGTFTVDDVAAETTAPIAVIRDYVARLHRGKFVGKVSSRGTKFRLQARPPAAPVSRPEQQQLWTAMRNLKSFTLNEAVFAAGTDELRVPKPFAKRYVEHLVEAGYLTECAAKVGASAETVYRLKPTMNTGPLAPALLRLPVVVFDRNEARVHLDVNAEECAA